MNSREQKMTRRNFLKQSAVTGGFALLGSGLKGFIPGPYPAEGQEIPTIEKLTKGQVKVGDTIHKDNVELVKSLLNPGTYEKVKRGAQLPIMPTRTKREDLMPVGWIEATERNKGTAVLDRNGILRTKDGKPWIGGHPFPNPANELELLWNFTTQSGFEYANDAEYKDEEVLIKEGKPYRSFLSEFKFITTIGRVFTEPKPYYPGKENELYRIYFFITQPFDFRGSGFLTVQPYNLAIEEARVYGYIPALRRVRQLPTSQRWESSIGDDVYVSDINFHNDSILSWTWKLLEKKPMLGVHMRHFRPEGPVKKGEYVSLRTVPYDANRFPRGPYEVRPAVYVLEGRPKDRRSPYSKKILYIDSVLLRPIAGDWYDRQGNLWKTYVFFYELIDLPWGEKWLSDGPISMVDLQADHVTHFHLSAVRKNVGLKVDDYFTEKSILQLSY